MSFDPHKMGAPLPGTLDCCCVVVGGGPAGMMAAYLLARAGIDTVLLEKHGDFLRDFRGDTVHPSTLRIMEELGFLGEFLTLPHRRLQTFDGLFGTHRLRIADLRRLNVTAPFVAMMPQWDFLNFLAEKGRAFANLKILMAAEVTDLIRDKDRVLGVKVSTPGGPLTVNADLVIGADGRHSTVRKAAGLAVQDIGAPIDVLWFRVARDPAPFDELFGHVQPGLMLVTIDRGDYWQCAYVIPKGGYDRIKARGLDAFRIDAVRIVPALAPHIGDIKDWDDVKLLTVAIDRLTRWTLPGLLCIGDCAHAMSPVGGVGINLAIQDAVAAANMIGPKLAKGRVSEEDCDQVRRRRLWPAKVIQAMQVAVQNRVLSPAVLHGDRPLKIPLFLKIINAVPWLQGLTARVIGLGVRPEHVELRRESPAKTHVP